MPQQRPRAAKQRKTRYYQKRKKIALTLGWFFALLQFSHPYDPTPWSFQFLLWSSMSISPQPDFAFWIDRVILPISIFKLLKYVVSDENTTDLEISRVELIADFLPHQIMRPDFWLRKYVHLMASLLFHLFSHWNLQLTSSFSVLYALNICSYIYYVFCYVHS